MAHGFPFHPCLFLGEQVKMEHYKEFVEFAPLIVVVLMFIWQNNVFVRPDALEKKHREILNDIKQNYVEINAYKEFQNHIYSKLDELTDKIEDITAILRKRRKGDIEE